MINFVFLRAASVRACSVQPLNSLKFSCSSESYQPVMNSAGTAISPYLLRKL